MYVYEWMLSFVDHHEHESDAKPIEIEGFYVDISIWHCITLL